jgi:DNA-directed RNA polymerase subunit M/transcription elongation factor TFIIS
MGDEIIKIAIEVIIFNIMTGIFVYFTSHVKKIKRIFKVKKKFDKISISKKIVKKFKEIKKLLRVKHKILMIKMDDKKDKSRTAYCPKCGNIPSREEVADAAIFDKEHISYECKKCNKKYKMNIKTGNIKIVNNFGHDFRK